jgi:hypothetical protein
MKLNALLKTAGFLALAVSPAIAGSKVVHHVEPQVSEPTELGLTLGLGYDTDFVFRGVDFADNWISANAGLDLPLAGPVSLLAGASYGLSADDSARRGQVDGMSYRRLELNGGLGVDLGVAELGVGYRYYNHDGQLSNFLVDGHEVGVTLATAAGPINVGLGAYYDFEIEGYYFELAANTEVALTDTISLVPGASLGYVSDYNWHGQRGRLDGFTAVGLSLAMPIKLGVVTVAPYVAANLPIDALDAAGEDAIVFGGVRLSVSF